MSMSPHTASRTIRVALLICGKLTGPVLAIEGDYYAIYKRFLEDTIPPGSATEVVVDGYDVVNEMKYPDEDQLMSYDAVMLTGSAASAYENIEWINVLVAWVQRIIKDFPKIKIIGICYGHQIVSRALGGECVFTGRWEIGPTTLQLTELGKSLFGVDELNIQEMHRDHVPVESLPGLRSGELHLLGSTESSGNQGFVKFYPSSSPADHPPSLNQVQIITTQGHPEFSEPLVTGIVRQRSILGAMDAATTASYFGEKGDQGDDGPIDKNGTGRRYWRNDGMAVVGRALWKVMGVEEEGQ